MSTIEGTGGAATLTFTVTLSSPASSTVLVDYATSAGTASTPADFAAAAGTLTFTPGATTRTVPIALVTDALDEPAETFTLTLFSPAGATIADDSGTGTISNDDSSGGGGPVTLTLAVGSGDSDVNELSGALQTGSTMWIGNEAATGNIAAARFAEVAIPRGATVTSAHLEVRAAATGWNRVAFEYAAEASGQSVPFGPAALPSQRPLSAARVNHLTDTQWVSGTWYTLDEIAPIVHEVVNRGDWASGNALSILMRGTGFAWGRKFTHAYEGDPASAARLVVVYISGGPMLPALSISDVTVTEGTGGARSANFTVSLSASPAQTVAVGFATANGTATAPADYTAGSGTLTFAPGITTATVQVPVATDNLVEPTESFSVVLSNPANATIADGTGVVTILNDDAGAGPVTATFQIAAGGDDVNQEDTSLTTTGSPMWIGSGSSATSSYLGLRFAGVTIPRHASITSARLEVNAAGTAWITLGFEAGIESAASSAPFSAASLPSQRTLLASRVAHSSNQQWTADTWIPLDDLAPIVQALVARADWNPGNVLGLILRGTTGAWARKPIKSFETAATMAPRLVVTYTLP